jgi:hypothetical protein
MKRIIYLLLAVGLFTNIAAQSIRLNLPEKKDMAVVFPESQPYSDNVVFKNSSENGALQNLPYTQAVCQQINLLTERLRFYAARLIELHGLMKKKNSSYDRNGLL